VPEDRRTPKRRKRNKGGKKQQRKERQKRCGIKRKSFETGRFTNSLLTQNSAPEKNPVVTAIRKSTAQAKEEPHFQRRGTLKKKKFVVSKKEVHPKLSNTGLSRHQRWNKNKKQLATYKSGVRTRKEARGVLLEKRGRKGNFGPRGMNIKKTATRCSETVCLRT